MTKPLRITVGARAVRASRARYAIPAVLIAAVGIPPALAQAPGNLVRNASFETAPGPDWIGFRSSISQVQLAPGEAPGGSFVVQVVGGPLADPVEGYSVDDRRASGGDAVPAGTQFIASAFVRAASAQSVGKPGKVWVRERKDGELVGRINGEVPLTAAFQQVTSPVYTVQQTGNEIDVYVAQNPSAPGDAFQADLVVLTRNLPPAGEIGVSEANPTAGDTVRFSSAGISDPDGQGVATRAWETDGSGAFDDGTGVTVSRTFETAGTYVVRLRVADAAGATAVISRPITVARKGAAGGGGVTPGGPTTGARRPSLTAFSVVTRNRIATARFRVSPAVRISGRLERKRVARAGFARVRSTPVRRLAAGARTYRLGRLATGRYRVRLVLTTPTGATRIVVKAFRIR